VPQELDSYTERLPQVRRVLRLHRDAVHIDAKWLMGRRYSHTVNLSDLKPQYRTFYVRNQWFRRAILIGSLGAAAAVVFSGDGYPLWLQQTSIAMWGLTGIMFSVAAITLRKTRFARFLRTDGKAGLDVAAAGPSAAGFEAFVANVQKQIRRQ